MSYEKYIAWKRLTHNGSQSQDEMSEAQRDEYGALGISQAPALSDIDVDEAKRAYL